MIACGVNTDLGKAGGMSVSEARARQHVCVAADLSLHFQVKMGGYVIAHLPKEKFNLKVGVHTGQSFPSTTTVIFLDSCT